ncbi:hypothetical protein EDB83DRAFT_235926 [Lactarius deliciosus]|nr:hypothetical protein EDB83DRAFT_235926 [Lactarius deliciosus]
MDDRRAQPPNHLSEDAYPHPLHQLHDDVQQHVANPHAAGDGRQEVHLERIPRPMANVAMQGRMEYPHPQAMDSPRYNAAQDHLPPPPYPEVPYMHVHQGVGAAQGDPVQPYAFAPGFQGNPDGLFGYGARFPAANPPEAFPGIWPLPAPLVNMPPVNGLRNLASRYLNHPDTRVSMVRIEPGPGGHFEVWITLELADVF